MKRSDLTVGTDYAYSRSANELFAERATLIDADRWYDTDVSYGVGGRPRFDSVTLADGTVVGSTTVRRATGKTDKATHVWVRFAAPHYTGGAPIAIPFAHLRRIWAEQEVLGAERAEHKAAIVVRDDALRVEDNKARASLLALLPASVVPRDLKEKRSAWQTSTEITLSAASLLALVQAVHA